MQHNTTSPRGGLWRSRSPSSALCFGLCSSSQLAKRQTVSPGCQHLLQRLYHLPGARGEHLSRLRPAAEPQTWTRAVLQRQRTRPRHSQSRRVLEHLSHTLSCVLSVGCNHREVEMTTKLLFTGRVKVQPTERSATAISNYNGCGTFS